MSFLTSTSTLSRYASSIGRIEIFQRVTTGSLGFDAFQYNLLFEYLQIMFCISAKKTCPISYCSPSSRISRILLFKAVARLSFIYQLFPKLIITNGHNTLRIFSKLYIILYQIISFTLSTVNIVLKISTFN